MTERTIVRVSVITHILNILVYFKKTVVASDASFTVELFNWLFHKSLLYIEALVKEVW